MASYWALVNRVIDNADILLIIIDARLPELTRNTEIESKIIEKKRKLLFVINKSDLVKKEALVPLKRMFNPSVFVSSKERLGGTILMKKILEISKGEKCYVGVLGYPNVGKSSVINLLKGGKAARVSPQSGFTRGLQFVSAKGKIKLIDTPGVLPFDEKDFMNQVLIGSKNPEHLKEPEFYAMGLIERYPEMFEKVYKIKYEGDADEFLEKAAVASKVLIKGGYPDVPRFARQLLYNWQRGKIHEVCLEKDKISKNKKINNSQP